MERRGGRLRDDDERAHTRLGIGKDRLVRQRGNKKACRLQCGTGGSDVEGASLELVLKLTETVVPGRLLRTCPKPCSRSTNDPSLRARRAEGQ